MSNVRMIGFLAPTECPEEAEDRAWEAMPFVRLMEGKILSNWLPVRSDDYFVARQRGVHHAYMVVQHLRWHHNNEGVDATRRLSDLFRSMSQQSIWTGTELAFTQSLANYLASIRTVQSEALECS